MSAGFNVAALRALMQPRVVRLGRNFYACAFQCMKLVPAEYILGRAVREGRLRPGDTVYETTSGTFGLGIAQTARAYGLRAHLVSDTAVDPSLAARFEILGAAVEIVDADADGSFQTPRLRRLHELLAQNPGAFWLDQYDNPLNAESYGPVAERIAAEIAAPVDRLVAPVGSGGSSAGLTRRLRGLGHPCLLHAVDTPGSVIFGCPDRKRLLRGLGNSLLPKNVAHDLVDEVHWIPAAVAFNEARRVFADRSVDVGPTSGASFHVARHLADAHPEQTIVVVFPDNGERYRHDVLSPQRLRALGCFDAPSPATPQEVRHPGEVVDAWCAMRWNRRCRNEVVRPGKEN